MKKFEDPILQALPFPIWEEDYSEIKKKLLNLGIWGLDTSSFKQKFKDDSDLVKSCISSLKIVKINDACLKLYQLPTVEALENYFFDNFSKHFQQSFIAELAYINEGRTEFEIFEELITPKKTIKNIRLEFVVMDQDLRQVLVQITDVTKEFSSKKQIETLVKRNDMALKSTGAAVWEWDLLTNETYWSDEYYNLFGIEPGAIKYGFEEWAEKIHPEERDSVLQGLNDALHNKSEYWEMEYRIKTPEKGFISIIDRGTIVLDESGQAIKMVGAINDITLQKNIMNQLIQQNNFIETILENIPIGVAANYIDSGKVKLINKNFTEIYGWEENELINVDSFFEKVYPDPEYREQIRERIFSDIVSGDPNKMNWSGIEITTKAGQKRIVSAKNIPLPNENLMISTVNDETDLHKAIHELEQFAYVASHDLQEPLRMISSFLSLLEKKYEKELDDKAKTYIGYAVDGANRMKDMINNLLEYSRVNRRPEKQEYLNLNDLINETQALLKVLIDENQAKIEIPYKLPTIKFSKSLLIQVFQNLITNAIQNKKDTEKPNIQILGSEVGVFYKIEVRDNGVGIPPERKEKIFQLFQSYGNERNNSKRGIGLAICKKIIERLGGKIWVESDGKTGSSFYLTIPK